VDLRASAAAALRANDNGGYTVPSRAIYPPQWAWTAALYLREVGGRGAG
jgi:hypothetical protein